MQYGILRIDLVILQNNMVLVDAVFINNSGGKILLDYLIEQLEKTDIEIYYLLDKRVENRHPVIKPGNKVQYIKGGLLSRHRFYQANGDLFQKILCFANFPPGIRVKGIVYTYFHQLLFIKTPAELSFFTRLLIRLKVAVFKWSVKNTDYWLVQSNEVKSALSAKFKDIVASHVLVLPFYPPLITVTDVGRKKHSFLYVSTGHPYKNHERLLAAFVFFFNEHKIGELHLTVGPDFADLYKRVVDLQQTGYPIINHGFVERSYLGGIYRASEFVIYPSIAESFGLGIVEAIENGCKIIGSDLPWLYAVCEPSIVFDPKSAESIHLAINKTLFAEVKPSTQLVFDEIGHLIDLLK